MHKIHIVVMVIYLATAISCEVQEGESKNVTSVESTTDAIKTIEKRQTLTASAEVTNEPAQNTSLGLNSLAIQILGGLVQNMLSSNGINSQTIGSAINLFNPEKIKSDLLLLRRSFNLLARFGLVINRYLPNPTASGNSFKPLDLFSSKVRLYTPESGDSVQWVPKNKLEKSTSLSKVPLRVQMMVDYVTQRPLVTSSTEKSNVLENSSEEVEAVVENLKEDNAPDDSITIVEKQVNVTTNSSQNYPSQENGSSNITVKEENVVKTTASLEYGLPTSTVENKPVDILQANDLLLTVNNNEAKPLSTTINPNKIEVNSNDLPVIEDYGPPLLTVNSATLKNPAQSDLVNNKPERRTNKDGLPSHNKHPPLDRNQQVKHALQATENKPEEISIGENQQPYHLHLTENSDDVKANKIIEEYGLPSESGGNFKSGKPESTSVNSRFEDYGLPDPKKISIAFNTVPIQEYGVPGSFVVQTITNSGRRRDKSGLPFQYGGEVFAGLPHFDNGPQFHNNGIYIDIQDRTRKDGSEHTNYGSIADIPLERNTIFDRRHGILRDSFGFPVRP